MSPSDLLDISLIGMERKRIKSLTGFRRGHRVPDEKSGYTDAFIGRIAEANLQADLETCFADLRKHFSLKRRDISKDGPAAGQGTLITPAFEYTISTGIDAADPSHCHFVRRVANLKDVDAITSDAFDLCFRSRLDAVEISAVQPIDVEAVIDAIEDADPDELILDYNADATECRVQPRDSATRITVTADALVVRDNAIAPSSLFRTAIAFRSQFLPPSGGATRRANIER